MRFLKVKVLETNYTVFGLLQKSKRDIPRYKECLSLDVRLKEESVETISI